MKYLALALSTLAAAGTIGQPVKRAPSVECHPHLLANSTLGFTAVDDLYKKLPLRIEAGDCLDVHDDPAVAVVCNRGKEPQFVTLAKAQANFDLLNTECFSERLVGHVHDNGLVFSQWYKTGLAKPRRGIEKRQCSNGENVLVDGCSVGVCDPANRADENGNCPHVTVEGVDGCASYCEVRLAKYHGPPSRLENMQFCQATTCGVEKTVEYTQEVSASFNLGGEIPIGNLGSVLSAGISVGVAFSTTHGSTQVWAVEDECGRFVKAPIHFESCGDMTYRNPNFGGEGGQTFCLVDADIIQTDHNVCSTGQLLLSDGTPEVPVVFERADCSTQQPLPIEQQHESYQSAYGAGAAQGPRSC